MRKLHIDNYVIDTPLIDILKDVKEQIRGSKLAVISNKGDWIRITCPKHSNGQESNPSCGVYVGDDKDTDYGFTNCFTCGLSCDFTQTIAECFNTSYENAKEWLIAKYGVKEYEHELQIEPIELKPKKKTEYLDEAIIDTFQSWHPYMDKRHLNPKVCKEFKVKYDPKTESIVFPVYNEYGKLWMLTRRSVNNKTFIIDKDKEKPVYLMYYIRQNNIKEVTICESQINALTLWSEGVPAVATFGCKVTSKQVDILNKSGLTHIYICYDGDTAGIKGTKNLIEKLSPNILVDVIIMDEGKDVNDISEERFSQLPIMHSEDWMKVYGNSIKN